MNIQTLAQEFERTYGATPRIFSAPGRVNLIGEHTDYNDGFVLPLAIEQRTYVAAVARPDRRVRVRSLDMDAEHTFHLDEPGVPQRGAWSDYAEGVARVLQQRGQRLEGADMLLFSDVPSGAGLSSSAALEISLGYALLSLSEQEIDRVQLALAAQAAEHTYVGTLCGIMDQYVTALASPGNALLIDCRSLTTSAIPVNPAHVRVIVCDSGVKHSLASSAYNERRIQCREGVELLRPLLPEIRALRDVDTSDLRRHGAVLPELIAKRCRHVVTENERTRAAAAALGAEDYEKVGQLMNASHDSLRDDYEVSCEELDVLVDAARAAGALGARMTGGGFGGCTISLVRPESVSEVTDALVTMFESRFGVRPLSFVTQPSGGVREQTV